MEVLDTTIVNVSLPHIAGSLSASNDQATWTLTTYLVANGIVLAISGCAGGVLGRKQLLRDLHCDVHRLLFSCGTVDEPGPELIVSARCRDFSAADCSRTSRPSSWITFPPEKRQQALRRSRRLPSSSRRCSGPTLGGYLTDHAIPGTGYSF